MNIRFWNYSIYHKRVCTCTQRFNVTSTCPFISWCLVSANIKWTPQVWHSSLNSVEVNCIPASDEILYKSYHPSLSIFSRYGLEHIQLLYNFFCCDFIHIIKFWNFGLGINNWKISKMVVSLIKLLGAVDGIRSIQTHLKGAFEFSVFLDPSFLFIEEI